MGILYKLPEALKKQTNKQTPPKQLGTMKAVCIIAILICGTLK